MYSHEMHKISRTDVAHEIIYILLDASLIRFLRQLIFCDTLWLYRVYPFPYNNQISKDQDNMLKIQLIFYTPVIHI